MKRYILYILCVLFAVLFITGCESKEERAQRKKNEKQAAEQAVQFMYEKYGFTPEVLSSDSDYMQGMFGKDYSQEYLIKMVYNEREFLVYMMQDGQVRDSYQHEEICQALRTEINDRIPGVTEFWLRGYQFFSSNDYRSFIDCLCSEYFDGTNLLEVLNDCRGTFCAYYVHGDFSDESRFTWLYNTDSETEESSNAFDGHFISLRSEDGFVPGVATRDIFRGRAAIYVESYRDTEGIYEQYDLKQYGDLYYLIYLSDYGYNQPDHDVLSISEGVPPSRRELSEICLRFHNYTLSEVFNLSIYEKVDDVIVFYPVSEIDGFDTSDTEFLKMWTDSEGKIKHDHGVVSRVGDYAVSSYWFRPGDYNIFFIFKRDTEE